MVPRLARLAVLLPLAAATAACGDRDVVCVDEPSNVERPAGWNAQTHCDGVRPDYARLFDAEVVHRFELEISRADHQATLDDLEDWYADASGDLDGARSPIYVPATVRYDGRTWTRVGMRYKGHSSLKAAWGGGARKLSFVLDFDEYEAAYPGIRDQRFFGFRRLSFSNAYHDPSLLREKLAGEIFRAGGVPAARSAFAAVYLDWGDGPTYLGLYTMLEDPCDRMLETQLGDGSGELYKPWGEAARWLVPGAVHDTQVNTDFETCDPDDPSDRSDIRAAIAALHAPRSDPARWRAGLEQRLKVDRFLRALALNQVMMNWDSYGCMHHNYYVYADPLDAGRFVWIPWDLNEAMLDRERSGCPAPGSVLLDEIVHPDPTADPPVDADWPLIALLLADPDYCRTYCNELQAALHGAFVAEPLVARMRRYHVRIRPWVVGPEATEEWPYTNTTPEAFLGSLAEGDDALETHLAARRAAVEAAVPLSAPCPCP
ncbi:MAG: CotH kinase family protein [Deltaproteobacteria bacterium]|nr:CotH kinase family protein [Deltaproteobacteria bacterium]